VALGSMGARQAATSRPASGEGARETIAAHPGSRMVLGLLAVGFLGYAVLGLVQAGFRQQQLRNRTERRAKRLFFAASRSCTWPSRSMPPPWRFGPDRGRRAPRAPDARRPS
jgi:hypothetical protein